MAVFFGKSNKRGDMARPAAVPGAEQNEPARDAAAALLTRPTAEKLIGEEEVKGAVEILQKYKSGKANLEKRIVDDELWWELRHWEAIGGAQPDAQTSPKPTSAWLFNSILNKHADAMDNYPEPIVLPREQSDEKSAKTLSEILPVVLECNGYDHTYSDGWWEKLKHGTAAYGVFWNSEKENGIGDIDVRGIDLLKIFWEPGITDIQKSRNLFIVELVDNDLLYDRYPEHKGRFGGNAIEVKRYNYDDAVDVSDKSLVVDWYYKVKAPSGKTILHYAKFVGETLLYASQNEPEYRDVGFYEHGLYPVVLDVMFPEKGTPVGFGYVSICRDPQLYIDKLSANILENAMMATKRRYFASSSTAINKEQFLDWNTPIVDVEGEISDARIKEIVVSPLDSIYVNVLQMKIEEMKDTSANRDVNSGGSTSGVTAASAIAALQEAGNKASRDMISASYRAHVQIGKLCTELMRQFYDETRSFRITGDTGAYRFVNFNNSAIRDQQIGVDSSGAALYRRPVFDLKIVAQKKNPFSRMEQNERAKELYGLGFFNPERAQEALPALEMMDFEGIDKVREQIMQGQTLLNICRQMQDQMAKMSAIIQAMTGGDAQYAAERQQGGDTAGGASAAQTAAGKNEIASESMRAHTPMTDYGTRLAGRSSPNMDFVSDAAKPQ